MKKLFIIEDHPVIIAGLHNLFHFSSEGFKISGHANSLDEFLRNKDKYEIDIIILDLYLPGTRPDENVRKLRELYPDVPIVIYTSEESDVWKRKMIGLGVHAYITKDATKAEMIVTLNKVAKGEYVISLKSPFRNTPHQGLSKPIFTKNQMEILNLLCDVKNQEKIAKIKGTTVSNIEKTLKIMRRNAGVSTNLELIKHCTEHGLL